MWGRRWRLFIQAFPQVASPFLVGAYVTGRYCDLSVHHHTSRRAARALRFLMPICTTSLHSLLQQVHGTCLQASPGREPRPRDLVRSGPEDNGPTPSSVQGGPSALRVTFCSLWNQTPRLKRSLAFARDSISHRDASTEARCLRRPRKHNVMNRLKRSMQKSGARDRL